MDPKGRILIDGLQFTSEGYNRESIFRVKYGRPSEVVNAYIQGIMQLIITNRANLQITNEFCEDFFTSPRESSKKPFNSTAIQVKEKYCLKP